MADVMYNFGRKCILDGTISWDSDTTIKVALVTSSYTPDVDNHDYFDDITNEVTGTGYTAGGATLTSKAVNQDNTNDRAEADSADVTWSTATLTAAGAIVYKSTGNAATSPLIAYMDLGGDQTSSASDFKLTVNAEGWFYI